MPRSVLDTIPQSRLASYGNFLYDEAREQAYISDTSTPLAFAHNLTHIKDPMADECWMWPEVERAFEILSSPITKWPEQSAMLESEVGGIGCDPSHDPHEPAVSLSELVLHMNLQAQEVRGLWTGGCCAHCPHSALSVHSPEFRPRASAPTSLPAPAPSATCDCYDRPAVSAGPARGMPARRLYSSVLQSGTGLDEVDDLERQALEQYSPAAECVRKASSGDNIVAAKFQELERLAMEQYGEQSVAASNSSSEPTGEALRHPPLVVQWRLLHGTPQSSLHSPPYAHRFR